MKEKIIEFADLSDSREMLEAKTPNFITFFIILISGILIIAFCWMWFGEIDVVVKATGIVRPGQTISVVRSATGGFLKDVNYFTGKRIKEGDILFSIDNQSFQKQKQHINKQIEDIKNDLTNLTTLKKSIQKNENLFNKNIDENSMIYNKRYLSYKNRYQQLEIEYQKALNNYKKERTLGPSATTESRLKELESELNYAKLNIDRYELEKLINLDDQIKTKKTQLEELNQQKQKIIKDIDISKKYAPISGIIHSIQDFNPGEYLPAGIEVLRIIPQSETNYLMELTVANEDISELREGQKIKYRFLALPYREYGVLTGEILDISGDISKTGENRSDFVYEAKATIDRTTLENNRGEKVNIKSGMISEARIVVRSRKILYLVLEKLDFLS